MQIRKNWVVIVEELNWSSGFTGMFIALYRPAGEKEMELIGESGWRAFPPRLPGQPIFYPVLNIEYANQIARDWNTRYGGTGYVMRFHVDSEYLQQFPVQRAGGRVHQEYWIPAEKLEEFNRHIVGQIQIVSEFHGTEPM